MTSRDFAYWLQGLFELSPSGISLDGEQTDKIRKHLAMVFLHEIDPSFGPDREALQAVHDGESVEIPPPTEETTKRLLEELAATADTPEGKKALEAAARKIPPARPRTSSPSHRHGPSCPGSLRLMC